MGFLDNMRDKFDDVKGQLGMDQAGGYDDYDDYDDDYADGNGGNYYTQSEPMNGVLGQTRRGEAETVAVYTRSGQVVGDASRHATMYNPPSRSGEMPALTNVPAPRMGAYQTPSSYAQSTAARGAAMQNTAVSQAPARAAYAPAQAQAPARPAYTPAAAPAAAPAANGYAQAPAQPTGYAPAPKPVPAGQLPAYILKPESYDDVETVVRRVRTKQPVALVFSGVRTDVAKRVLDFSYGFACGSGASVQEVGDRIFMVLPQGCELQRSDVSKLRTQGYLR